MQRRLWLLTCFSVALAWLAGAGAVSARIYHWIDEAGTPHFSDRAEGVPAAYRDQIGNYQEEFEQSTRVNIIDGLNGPSRDTDGEAEDGVEHGSPPPGMPEIGEIPGFATDPSEMIDRLKGPMIVLAVVLTLVVFGFLLAFMTVSLLVGCRLVSERSPGFKKAYGIVIVQFLAGVVAGPGVIAVFGEPNVSDMGAVLRLQAVNLGVFLLVYAAVLRGMLCESMGKSIGLALAEILVLVVLALLLGLGIAMCAGGAAILGTG